MNVSDIHNGVEVFLASLLLFGLFIGPYTIITPVEEEVEPIGGGPTPKDTDYIDSLEISTGDARLDTDTLVTSTNDTVLRFNVRNPTSSTSELTGFVAFSLPSEMNISGYENVSRIGNLTFKRPVHLSPGERVAGNIRLGSPTDSPQFIVQQLNLTYGNGDESAIVSDRIRINSSQINSVFGTDGPTPDRKSVMTNVSSTFSAIFHPYPQPVKAPLSPLRLFVLVIAVPSGIAFVRLTQELFQGEPLTPLVEFIDGMGLGMAVGLGIPSYLIGSIVWIPLLLLNAVVFHNEVESLVQTISEEIGS